MDYVSVEKASSTIEEVTTLAVTAMLNDSREWSQGHRQEILNNRQPKQKTNDVSSEKTPKKSDDQIIEEAKANLKNQVLIFKYNKGGSLVSIVHNPKITKGEETIEAEYLGCKEIFPTSSIVSGGSTLWIR